MRRNWARSRTYRTAGSSCSVATSSENSAGPPEVIPIALLGPGAASIGMSITTCPLGHAEPGRPPDPSTIPHPQVTVYPGAGREGANVDTTRGRAASLSTRRARVDDHRACPGRRCASITAPRGGHRFVARLTELGSALHADRPAATVQSSNERRQLLQDQEGGPRSSIAREVGEEPMVVKRRDDVDPSSDEWKRSGLKPLVNRFPDLTRRGGASQIRRDRLHDIREMVLDLRGRCVRRERKTRSRFLRFRRISGGSWRWRRAGTHGNDSRR